MRRLALLLAGLAAASRSSSSEHTRTSASSERKAQRKSGKDRDARLAHPLTGPACSSDGGPRRWPPEALERARFYAWVSCKDAQLLEHFLDWYLGLGLRLSAPKWARIVLHCPNSTIEASMNVFKERNLSTNVHFNNEPFSAIVKTKDANRYLKTLPKDALFARADLDELFDAPPEAIAKALEEDHGFVRGRFVDRIAEDWRLNPITSEPLWRQFPRKCRATHPVFGGYDRKWLLVPSSYDNKPVRLKGSHNVDRAPVIKRTWDVAHYRFDASAFVLLQDKFQAYASRVDAPSVYASRIYEGLLTAFEETDEGVLFRAASKKLVAYTLDAPTCRCGSSVFREKRGAVYAATGGPEYVDLAMLSALQLGDASVHFFVDDASRDYCRDRALVLRKVRWACAVVDAASLTAEGVAAHPGTALKWAALREKGKLRGVEEKVSRGIDGRIAGILAMLASPFQDTLFLDADAIPCFSLKTLFASTEASEKMSVFDAYDVLMAHEYHTLKGFLGDEAHGAPDAFGLLNAGVVLYRWRDAVRRFLLKWLDLYISDLEAKLKDPGTYAPNDGRAFQRQPAMQWAAFKGAAKDGLRVHALSAVWNARSWRPSFSGAAKRTTSDLCCARHRFTNTTVLVDHHCNASVLPPCLAKRSATLDATGLGVSSDARHARPRRGC